MVQDDKYCRNTAELTLAKAEFSNSRNSNLQFWSSYIKGDVLRQEILRVAFEWVVKSSDDEKIENYMSLHRDDKNIFELKNYFNSVIDWIDEIFSETYSEMCGLDWGRLFETYHEKNFDVEKISAEVKKLFADEFVTNKRGIFEYVLSGGKLTKLLHIRIFEESTKKTVYARQTNDAKNFGKSNCPLCAIGRDKNSKKFGNITLRVGYGRAMTERKSRNGLGQRKFFKQYCIKKKYFL